MASGYSATALGVLYIALVRNLRKDYRQHASFKEQITYWADLIRNLGLKPENDDFASSVLALEYLYQTQPQRIDAMHQAIADVLTRLSDSSQTGGFQWSNCDFAAFQDIILVAKRPDIGTLSPAEMREKLAADDKGSFQS